MSGVNEVNKTRSRAFRSNPTDAERALWRQLRCRQLGGYKFRRQQPVGQYIVDFVCLERRVIIELDGGQHAKQVGYDAERTAWLESQGFRVLRFWNNQVFQELEGVKTAIGNELGLAGDLLSSFALLPFQSPPIPTFPRPRGEGVGE